MFLSYTLMGITWISLSTFLFGVYKNHRALVLYSVGILTICVLAAMSSMTGTMTLTTTIAK